MTVDIWYGIGLRVPCHWQCHDVREMHGTDGRLLVRLADHTAIVLDGVSKVKVS